MKSRSSRRIPKKRIVSGFGSAFIVMGTLFILPQTAGAQISSLKMPDDMCDILREEPLDQALLDEIRNNPNFVRIMEYVDETCGELGGLLIGVVESVGGLLLGESLGQVGIFVIFIAVLMLRPQGFFGAKA